MNFKKKNYHKISQFSSCFPKFFSKKIAKGKEFSKLSAESLKKLLELLSEGTQQKTLQELQKHSEKEIPLGIPVITFGQIPESIPVGIPTKASLKP